LLLLVVNDGEGNEFNLPHIFYKYLIDQEFLIPVKILLSYRI
jgi:hypothetical protein